MGEIN